MRTRRTPLLVVTALALLAAACTADRPERRRSQGSGWEDEITGLGACRFEPEGPVDDLTAALSVPGAWLRVDAIFRGQGEPKRLETRRYMGEYLPMGGDPAHVARLPRDVGFLFMPNTTAVAIEEAIKIGLTVTVRTGAGGDPRQVAYAVAALPGQAFFVGECAYSRLTLPMTGRYRVARDRYLHGLLGRTAAEIRALLAVPEDQVDFLTRDGDLRILDADHAPRSLLRALARGWLTVRNVPATWSRDAQLCAVAAAGRSGCVRLAGAATDAGRRELYYDAAAPTIELVLYERGDDGARIARVAVVDLAARVRAAGFDPAKDGLAVRVDLAAEPSLADVVADPATRAGVTVAVAPCAVGDCDVP